MISHAWNRAEQRESKIKLRRDRKDVANKAKSATANSNQNQMKRNQIELISNKKQKHFIESADLNVYRKRPKEQICKMKLFIKKKLKSKGNPIRVSALLSGGQVVECRTPPLHKSPGPGEMTADRTFFANLTSKKRLLKCWKRQNTSWKESWGSILVCGNEVKKWNLTAKHQLVWCVWPAVECTEVDYEVRTKAKTKRRERKRERERERERASFRKLDNNTNNAQATDK
jgi:hypothetical protein